MTQLQQLADGIYTQALDLHNKFNAEIWGNKKSFHNAGHIEAVWKSAELLLEAVKMEKDPLGIVASSQKLVDSMSLHVETQDLASVREILKIAIACHDLGNTGEIVLAQASRNDEIGFEFLDMYRAKGAEERSVVIAVKLISIEAEKLKMNQKEIDSIKAFVTHLIKQTTFVLEDDSIPFAQFMRVVDQLSTGYFRDQVTCQEGLLLELQTENPDVYIDEDTFWNFTPIRTKDLLPDEKQRQEVLEIWGVI